MFQCQGYDNQLYIMVEVMGFVQEKECSFLSVLVETILVDLKMKEGTSMSNHLNEFNTIFSNLSA